MSPAPSIDIRAFWEKIGNYLTAHASRLKVDYYSTAGTLDDKPASRRAYMGRPIRSVKTELSSRRGPATFSSHIYPVLPTAYFRSFSATRKSTMAGTSDSSTGAL